MRIEEFDFDLPRSLIAQFPLEQRDASRLLVLDRTSGEMQHRYFRELPQLLRPSDLLVVNDAKVIAARLIGRKKGSGGEVELLPVRPFGQILAPVALASPINEVHWVCLGRASKGLKPKTRIELAQGFEAEIVEALGEGEFVVRFFSSASESFADLLDRAGRIPLPPYIHRSADPIDRHRYQTIYAEQPGSVAAPTAGLHFTPELFERLTTQGIRRVAVTLDVGPGTFLPVREVQLENHRMHAERYQISAQTAEAVNEARRMGQRVVAVGTTVVRALESATRDDGLLREGHGETTLFIRPGFRFRQVDALLTNFHLPKSTLLILVGVFAGRERVLAAYREAVWRGYRFFSYGDAMLISDA
jgi:S-adenosylmethionine:tRNA ribosyltransferase-isomerase